MLNYFVFLTSCCSFYAPGIENEGHFAFGMCANGLNVCKLHLLQWHGVFHNFLSDKAESLASIFKPNSGPSLCTYHLYSASMKSYQ